MVEANRFFSLYLRGSLSQLFATPVFYESQCDSDLLHGEYENYKFPVIFLSKDSEYIKNNKKTDFLNTGYGGLIYAVSEKVVDVLSSNNITGWKTYPVEVYTQEGELIKGFNGFTITGRCGAVKPSLCEEVIIPPTYKGGPSVPGYKGDPLDLNTWDGSDIFILEHTVYKYATAKVKNVLSKLKNSNVAFEDIAERLIPQKDAIWKAPMGVVINE